MPALTGLALASYLSFVAWAGGTPAACGAGSDCDAVQGSRFASVFGVPVAVWGMLAYACLVGVALRVRSAHRHGAWALLLSGPALAASVYLTAISLFVIGATCAWCLGSLALIAACFLAALRAQPGGLRKARGPLATTAAIALLAVGTLHVHFQSALAAGPEDPRLRALATHLADSGAVFYGASWCEHCEAQKARFGGSAHRLPYVECSPHGPRAPQADACLAAGVDAYPTWIIDGQRFEGILEPERLARLSGFEPGEAEPDSPASSDSRATDL